MAMISVRNLTKRYGRAVAVRDISFEVAEGEIVGFLGPNGAGKSTTMRILAGFLRPSAGDVSVAGFDSVDESLEARRRIGYLPESVALYPEMRVSEYLHFRAGLKGLSGQAGRARSRDVMALCDIEDSARQIIGRLSKGVRQRIGLADCLLHDPPVLILDEPSLGLDPNQLRSLRSLIGSQAGRRTVLLSTHLLAEVEMTCGRVLIMNRGRIVASDTASALLASAKGGTMVVAEVRAPAEVAEKAFSAVDGVRSVRTRDEGGWLRVSLECDGSVDIRGEVSAVAARNGWAIRELHSEGRRLEEVFASFTGAGGAP